MSVCGNDHYRKRYSDNYWKGLAMYDVAQSIQTERRCEAANHRVLASIPRKKSVSFGRYRLTLSHDPQTNSAQI